MVKNIVVLTGAGISAESGLSTFRDETGKIEVGKTEVGKIGGIWAEYDYREVATPEGFLANPALVHEFYNKRRAMLLEVAPNAAHIALADLEKRLLDQGAGFTLVTQNVDDLHARAGSINVLQMHGQLNKVKCVRCEHIFETCNDVSLNDSCPECFEVGGIRPHIVWFGEIPHYLDDIDEALSDADLFVSIGTSGSVYPAAGLVGAVRQMNIPSLELNLVASENAALFTHGVYGPATVIVPEWVESVFEDNY